MSELTLLIGGLAVLGVADLVLAAAASPLIAFIGAALWGMHMGLTQGLFAKLVADNAPVELRGTAFGIFNLVNGGALLLASIMAGTLWTAFGAPATFLAGAAFAMLALLGLLANKSKKSIERERR
jgi:MFS family permease